MAPRKDKNKIIDEAECSAAANKRKRAGNNINISGVRGVTFKNPVTHFPNNNIWPVQTSMGNLPQNTNVFGSDLGVSPLVPTQEETGNDGFIDRLIPQQNFIVNYHTNLMLQSVEEFWRRNLTEEIKKRKEIETKLKDQEEQANRFRQMYYSYEKRTFYLEQMVERQVAAERFYAAPPVAPDEEVQSCLVDLNRVQRMDVKCNNCRTRPATMLWLPCRHLCVCLVCERRVKACPICGVKKTESFKIDLP